MSPAVDHIKCWNAGISIKVNCLTVKLEYWMIALYDICCFLPPNHDIAFVQEHHFDLILEDMYS